MPYSYGLLGAYPPARSGAASFAAGLLHELTRSGTGTRGGVVRVGDAGAGATTTDIVEHMDAAQPDGPTAAARALNRFDVALVQYGTGIYGGRDGDRLLDVLDALRVPAVLVLYNVPHSPTPGQRRVLEQAVDSAGAVVVLAEAARARLLAEYVVDVAKLVVIPPGAPDLRPAVGPREGGPLILTWGLLGPGKGIEWAIGGLQRIKDLRPAPRYLVVGETHPQVRRGQGEAYRLGLLSRARSMRVSELVRFHPGHLAGVKLNRLIRQADVVLLPDDSNESVTSSVLVEAVAAGKPVVAAAFPHAVELLADGVGLVVPQGNSAAIGEALYRVLTEPELAEGMAERAARIAPALLWPAVADRYRAVVDGLLSGGDAVPVSDAVTAA
jgi:glycosyltransferase involved in cell wall biosynthesis